MCTCGGSTGSLEVLCCLLKLIGIAKSSVQESDAVVTKDRFKHIETKMEELQLKTVREMLYRESGAMQQLRHVERYVNEIIMGCQDAQSSTRFVVDNLGKIDKALAAACESAAAVWDAQYKRTKRSKEFEKKDGPWGPNLGMEWDMGPFYNIKTIYVSASDRIDSIRFEYKVDDKEYWTPRIGGEGGTLHQIELNSDEPIKFIRGAYDTAGLTKLEIITTKQTYSFGKGNGESIGFPTTSKLDCNYKIVGFFGRASSRVNAIGVYLEKCSNCPPNSNPSPDTN